MWNENIYSKGFTIILSVNIINANIIINLHINVWVVNNLKGQSKVKTFT